MSIQLVDNFYLNSSKPLDNRFVVGSQSFYTNRHDIDWKYVGMRVWDLNDGIPYVWDGSTYSSENSVSISGSGTVNKIPKFATSTTVTDSLIYDDGTYVGIGNNTPVYKLDVTGVIRTSVGFFGDGSNITNINADNITSGTLLLNRLQNSPSSNWLLSSNTGGPGQSTWVNPTAVTVGNSTNATNATNATNTTNVNVTSYSTSTTSYLLFANATGNTSVYLNTTYSPKVNPSSGRVIIGNSTAFTSQLRVVAPSSGTFDPLTVGYAAAYNNFKVSAFTNNTSITLSRFLSGGASASSSWVSFGNPNNYEEISFAGRTYINVNGSGTSDSRLLTFGGGGNDQIRFYMIGNSTTVPVVGGFGSFIERNMYINGTFSAGNVAMVSSDPNISCTKTITANADRWVSDFTTGTNAGVNAAQQTLSSVNYDRIVYVTHYSSGTGGAQIQVEASSGYKTTGRIYDSGYSSTSAIVPAGKQFRIYLDWVAGTTIYDITIYKLGRG